MRDKLAGVEALDYLHRNCEAVTFYDLKLRGSSLEDAMESSRCAVRQRAKAIAAGRNDSTMKSLREETDLGPDSIC